MGAKFGVDTTIYEGERKYEIIKARIRIKIRMRLQQIDLKEELTIQSQPSRVISMRMWKP